MKLNHFFFFGHRNYGFETLIIIIFFYFIVVIIIVWVSYKVSFQFCLKFQASILMITVSSFNCDIILLAKNKIKTTIYYIFGKLTFYNFTYLFIVLSLTRINYRCFAVAGSMVAHYIIAYCVGCPLKSYLVISIPILSFYFFIYL